MNTASRELCRELHELSGWTPNGVGSLWYTPHIGRDGVAQLGVSSGSTPAYPLGYLLRKLPVHISVHKHADWADEQRAGEYYQATDHASEVSREADTPEDAAAKLAIELLKAGVLQKEQS